MNKCMFSGRLTDDPKITRFEKSILAQFSMAVKNRSKDRKTGKYGVTFIDVKTWGINAENMEKYGAKGMEVLITSYFTNEDYEKDGQRKKYKCFVAEEIEYISGGKKKEDNGQATATAGSETTPPAAEPQPKETEKPVQPEESSIDQELMDMGFDDLPGFDVDNPFPG